MARFLSAEWFEEVAGQTPGSGRPQGGAGGKPLVIRQVVRGTPHGDVGYHVVVESGAATVVPPGREPGPADLTITTDWDTAAAMAQGELAAQAALIEGRLRISGNLAAVAEHAGGLAGADPVPPEVRDRTTY